MKSKITLGCFLLFSLFCNHSFAARQEGKSLAKKGPGHGKKVHEMAQIYNSPARIDPTGNWDVFTEVSFIYWHVSEECLDFAVVVSPGPNNATVDFPTPSFSYKPGFKVSLGTNFNQDNWTGKVEYTRLHATTDRKNVVATTTNPPNVVTTVWLQPNFSTNAAVRVSAIWNCDLDLIDFNIARQYYLGKSLIMKTFIGPRLMWLDQKFLFEANEFDPALGFSPASQTWRTKSWGLGPRLGVDFKWEVGYGLRLFGDFAGSLIYRRQRMRSTFSGTPDPARTPGNNSFAFRFIRPSADFDTGIGWGSYFNNHFWHFDIAVAYSVFLLMNENVMREVADLNRDNSGHKPGDLLYHGLTIRTRFDF